MIHSIGVFTVRGYFAGLHSGQLQTFWIWSCTHWGLHSRELHFGPILDVAVHSHGAYTLGGYTLRVYTLEGWFEPPILDLVMHSLGFYNLVGYTLGVNTLRGYTLGV